jgi:hypothetical protein
LIPNYFATESVGSMMVRCPQGQIEEDGGGQRRRGNDGEALSAEDCDWAGRCEDLKNHDKTCSYKIITCELEVHLTLAPKIPLITIVKYYRT